MSLVHDRRHRARPAATIGVSRFASRPARPTFRRAFRERGGLAGTGATRRFQFVFESRVFALQPCALPLEANPIGLDTRDLFAQPRILSSELVDRLGGFLFGAPAHPPVMPESSSQYKSDAVTKYRKR